MNEREPFEPGTYGRAFFDRIKGYPLARLQQMDRATDAEMTYTADDETARMVRSQAIFEAIIERDAAQPEGGR